jgi:type IV pilus assembly protein PilV
MIASAWRLGPPARRRMRGVSLIEMLVALLVLSFGLLGLAGLQANSLRNNTSAFHRSQANALAFDIMDRMRANKLAAVNLNYNIALGGSAAGSTIPAIDLGEWKANLAGLPSGDGSVQCTTATRTCVVTVQWDDTRGVGAAQQFVLSAEL